MVKVEDCCEGVIGSDEESVVGLSNQAPILDAAIEYLIDRSISSSVSAVPSSTDISMIA